MKCPLFTIGRTDVQMGVESDYGECLKEDCAVRDVFNQQCSVLSIKGYLHDIAMALEQIAEKMPHEGQFRK